MARTLLVAASSFGVCFVVGNGIQLLLGLPVQQIRQNLLPGLVSSSIVALYVLIRRKHRRG